MSQFVGDRMSARRRLAGAIVAVLGPGLLTVALLPSRDGVGVDTVLLLFVLLSVLASAVGGVLPALLAPALGFALANVFFIKPYGSLQVDNADELIDLLIFFAVAVLVGIVTEWGARARARSEGARVRAEWLAGLDARGGESDSVEVALNEARSLFAMNRVALVRQATVLAAVGASETDDERHEIDAGDGLQLLLSGPERVGADRGLMHSLALTTGRLWQAQQVAEQARRADELGRIDELRAGLLAAVGHDLRNPLAALRAAADTLRQNDLALPAEDRDELLAAIAEHAERLNHIIGNLLDASRLQTGVLSVQLRATELLEVLPEILRRRDGRIVLEIPDDLPPILADPGLLERVLENLVANADRVLPAGQQVTVAAVREAASVRVRVIDHGPGVAPERFDQIFAPFQHFGDRTATGVGLGLAIARGFAAAMKGSLAPSVTPGGGLTMTLTLEVADEPAVDR